MPGVPNPGKDNSALAFQYDLAGFLKALIQLHVQILK
jgi:hypothetical protein